MPETSAETSAEARRAEVWGDVVDLRRLRWSVVLGALSGLGFFLLGTAVFGGLVAQPTLARTYALLLGLVGCLLAGVVCARLFPPLRRVLDGSEADAADGRVDALLEYATGGLGADTDVPAATLEEMRRNGIDAVYRDARERGA